MPAFRSLLFVPGSRPERFAKALEAGADAVCIDLEDAVAPQQKEQARLEVAAFVRERPGAAGVRLNPVRGDLGLQDLRALSGTDLPFLMLPKVESAADVDLAAKLIGEVPLWPIVESAEGLRHAWEIAAVDGVAGVLFGAVDYSADVGCTLDWDALLYARGALAAAAGRAGVQLLDVPHLDLNDAADLAASTRRSKALGFTGRACIHPAQVETVNACHTPSAAEVDRARRIVEAFDQGSGGAALLDGKLIELPVLRTARRTLERAAS